MQCDGLMLHSDGWWTEPAIRQHSPGTNRAPVRRPRVTTRLLMIMVALVAVAIWAALELPQSIDQAVFRRLRAQEQAEWERHFQDAERERLRLARAVETERDVWRRDTGSPDELTEHYFASRREFYIDDASYQREMAAYHGKLATKYRWAKWFPFVSISRDPGPPSDPLSPPPWIPTPGKVNEPIGGISVAFSPSGTGLAVGCLGHAIRILELPSRKVLASLALPEFQPHSLVFSRDGTALYSVGEESNLVWRWNVVPGDGARAIPWIDRLQDQPGRLPRCIALACSPDGRTIAVAAGGYVRNPSPGSPAGTTSIYGIRLLAALTGALEWEYKGTGDSPRSVAFAQSGQTLACGTGPAVVILDSGTGKLKKMLKPVAGFVIAVAFSPDGRTLAGAGSDVVGFGGPLGEGRVTFWDVSTGKILRTLEGPTGRAGTVAFSPDGRTVAAGGTGRGTTGIDFYGHRAAMTRSEVRLWNAATGKIVWTAEGESHSAFSLSFSPDGASLAFCDEDYVYIVNAGTGRLKQAVIETVTRFRVRD